MQHCPAQNLHVPVLRVLRRQFLRELLRCLLVPRRVLHQRLHRGEVRGVLLVVAVDIGERIVGLSQGDSGAELEYARRQLVLRGEGGGVEVEDGRVLPLVEGVVDVDEFYGR